MPAFNGRHGAGRAAFRVARGRMTWDACSYSNALARPGVRGTLVAVCGVLGLAAMGVSSAPAQEPAAQSPDTLVRVVILSRHGVRSPLVDPQVLATWTASPWPVWLCGASPNAKCADGDLT